MLKNDKGEIILHPCELIEDNGKKGITPGDKYECKVDPDKEAYTFYVLSYSDKNGNITNDITKAQSTNLILNSNICEDESLIGSNNEDKCLYSYNVDGDAGYVGPVTAMEYLNKATTSWSNIKNLNIVYSDEGDSFGNFKILGKARMPFMSELGIRPVINIKL